MLFDIDSVSNLEICFAIRYVPETTNIGRIFKFPVM